MSAVDPVFEKRLPNETTALVLSILAILSPFICCVMGVFVYPILILLGWFIPLIPITLGIIAIRMARKEAGRYHMDPTIYKPPTQLKTAKTCGIVAIVFGAVMLLVVVVSMVVGGKAIWEWSKHNNWNKEISTTDSTTAVDSNYFEWSDSLEWNQLDTIVKFKDSVQLNSIAEDSLYLDGH